MRTTTKIRSRLSLLFVALAVMLAIPVMALADTVTITNGLSGSGQTTIAAGDPNGAKISYTINVEGAGLDGQGGCNARDGSSATVSFELPAGVTADKSSLSFSDCGTTQDVTFKSNTKGSYLIKTKTTDRGSTATAGTYKEASFTLNVLQSDTTPPVVGVPADVTAEATSSSGAAVTYTTPTATDQDPANPTVSCSPASGSTFGLGITPVVCSATDKAGNTGTSQFNVIVKDTTKPVVKVPADVTAEATSSSGAAVTYTAATATDAVDSDVSVSCSPASGSTFGLGSTAVNCSGTDDSGNKGEGSFNVKVQDTTKPSISGLPTEDVVKEATSSSGAVVDFPSITASDTVDGENLTVSCATADATPLKSGSTFPIGSKQVDCSVKDKAGNTATGSFNVKVQDTTKPVTNAELSAAANANGWHNADVTVTLKASDAASGVDATYYKLNGGAEQAYDSSKGIAVSEEGSNKVEYYSKDKAGNAEAAQSLEVKLDKTAPSVDPGDFVDATNWYSSLTKSFTASDSGSGLNSAADASFDLTASQQSTATTPTEVSRTVYDKAGNSTTRKVSAFIDATGPETSAKLSAAANTNGWHNKDVTVTLSASDSLSGVNASYYKLNGGAEQTYTSAGIAVSEEGINKVEYYSKDKAGNAEAAQSLEVKLDETAPSVNPADLLSKTWRNTPLAETFTASDSLSGLNNAADNSFELKASTESTNATTPTEASRTVYDKAGNSTTRKVSALIDLTKPVLNITDNNTATMNICSGRPTEPTFGTPTDALSGINQASIQKSWTPTTNATGVGTYKYSASVKDNATNEATYSKEYKAEYGTSTYSGLLQPINASGTRSSFKLGSTVPIKFNLMCGTTPVTKAVAGLQIKKLDSTASTVNETGETVTASTGNQFTDNGNGQYHFNLSTKNTHTNPDRSTVTFGVGTWELIVKLDDGTTRATQIDLR